MIYRFTETRTSHRCFAWPGDPGLSTGGRTSQDEGVLAPSPELCALAQFKLYFKLKTSIGKILSLPQVSIYPMPGM
jgi:hypothetical protein